MIHHFGDVLQTQCLGFALGLTMSATDAFHGFADQRITYRINESLVMVPLANGGQVQIQGPGVERFGSAQQVPDDSIPVCGQATTPFFKLPNGRTVGFTRVWDANKGSSV